jgi:hypothetical protein
MVLGLFSMLFACGGGSDGGSDDGVPVNSSSSSSSGGLPVSDSAHYYELTGNLGTHDPTITKEGDTWYEFQTGSGIFRKVSSNGLNWSPLPSVLPAKLDWWVDYVPNQVGTDVWAPDVHVYNGQVWMYYSISTFGSRTSAIGLLSSPTLAADTWADHGVVVSTEEGDGKDYNAIDPNLVLDENGDPWLSFGSWNAGGIQLVQLNDDDTSEDYMKPVGESISIASRGGGGIEAPVIIYRNNFYYLFVSVGTCCQGVNSTYRIHYGRATAITGPYLDKGDVDMLDGGGTLLEDGDDRWKGPGGQDIDNIDGTDVIAFHAYDAAQNGAAILNMATILWDDEDWPTFSDTGTPAPSGPLLAYYAFESDLDDSAGNFDAGTVVGININDTGDGDITYGVGVTDGSMAAVFDGASGIRLPDSLISSGTYTISLWLNPTSLSDFTSAFFGSLDTERWMGLVLTAPFVSGETLLWARNLTPDPVFFDGPVGSTITTGVWTHVAITVNNGDVEIYVNGISSFTGPGLPDLFSDSTGIFSLGVNWFADPPYNGMMDELRIYNVALTPEQVTVLAEPESAGLVANYAFEDDLSDSTGNFGAGTVVGININDTGDGDITFAAGATGGSMAAVFDGDSGIRLPDGLISGDIYSIALWLNPVSLSDFTSAFFGSLDTERWMGLVLTAPFVSGETLLWARNLTPDPVFFDGPVGSTITTGVWTHVAITVDNGDVEIYINGVSSFTGPGLPDLFSSGTGIFSLGVNWFGDLPYNGMMDDLRIYQRVITQSEVTALATP